VEPRSGTGRSADATASTVGLYQRHRSGKRRGPRGGGAGRWRFLADANSWRRQQGLTDEHPGRYGHFYGSLDIALAGDPQTILAVGMNGVPLPVEHGAPVCLRAETQLGSKMVKWLRGVEFVDDLDRIGQGQGGWREDFQHYSTAAGI
jgi:DMSO/TMAO reductase YedYZ molybdopterin-dependent catalytic subunit